MTETASVLTFQTEENFVPNSVGRMISGIIAKVVDEDGKGIANHTLQKRFFY
jgi:long-subunit acyl-CoA synthetase (AMP-forming)